MKPSHWQAIAKFVVAQQMRTPLFFIEWVRSLNRTMPAMLEKVLLELQQATAEDLATRSVARVRTTCRRI